MRFVWVWANRLSLGETLGLWLMLVGWMWRKCRLIGLERALSIRGMRNRELLIGGQALRAL